MRHPGVAGHPRASEQGGLRFQEYPGEEELEDSTPANITDDEDRDPDRPAEAEDLGKWGHDGGKEATDGDPLEEVPGIGEGHQGGGTEKIRFAMRSLPVLPFVFVGNLGVPALLGLWGGSEVKTLSLKRCERVSITALEALAQRRRTKKSAAMERWVRFILNWYAG